MGSLGNNPSPSSWPPYQSYRDCSQGICSIYCPQWCYIIFPPPPPFHDSYSDSGTNFSPLIIAIIGILASAFLLFSYYIVVAKYWRRRLNNNQLTSTTPELDSNQAQAQTNNHDQRPQLATSGLDEIVIKSIAICKYRKGDGFVDGTDCAVCLSEFQENENLRLLPKCSHAFHPPCIDTWLRSHSNCPLCRSNVSPIPIATAPPESHPPSTLLNISSLEFQRGSDLVLVVQESEGVASGQREGCNNDEVLLPKYPFSQSQFRCQSGNQEFRRSSSMGSFANSHNSLLIADILRTDEDSQAEIGIGSSNSREFENMTNMRRSISTGRFFTTSDHRRNSALILPN